MLDSLTPRPSRHATLAVSGRTGSPPAPSGVAPLAVSPPRCLLSPGQAHGPARLSLDPCLKAGGLQAVSSLQGCPLGAVTVTVLIVHLLPTLKHWDRIQISSFSRKTGGRAVPGGEVSGCPWEMGPRPSPAALPTVP